MTTDLEALREKLKTLEAFQIVSIDEFLPLAGSKQVYGLNTFLTTGNNNDADTDQTVTQDALIISFAAFSLYKKDATANTTAGVTKQTVLRDMYKAELTATKNPIIRTPVDIFLLNKDFEAMAHNRYGMYVPKNNEIKIKVTRTFISAASDVYNATEALAPTVQFMFSGFAVK